MYRRGLRRCGRLGRAPASAYIYLYIYMYRYMYMYVYMHTQIYTICTYTCI